MRERNVKNKIKYMKELKNLDRTELLEIANLFLNQTHSEGFKVAEAKDFLAEP